MLIYFIRDDADGTVKIGTADDPQKRLAMLQCGNPNRLGLFGVVPGSRAEEQRLHARLKPHRKRGEWFWWNEEVAEVVAEMVARYGESPLSRIAPSFLYSAELGTEAIRLKVRQAVRSLIYSQTHILCDVYRCGGNFLNREVAFQLMPDDSFSSHPFTAWHFDTNAQWYPTPGHAADAWVNAFRFWTEVIQVNAKQDEFLEPSPC